MFPRFSPLLFPSLVVMWPKEIARSTPPTGKASKTLNYDRLTGSLPSKFLFFKRVGGEIYPSFLLSRLKGLFGERRRGLWDGGGRKVLGPPAL